MKSWFPLTDYDFYAYLTSGGLALVVIDYIATGGAWLGRPDWTFVQIVAAIAASYIVGQMVGSISSALLEHGLARSLLAPPAAVQLGYRTAGPIGQAIGKVVVDRYYSPFTQPIRERICTAATSKLNGLQQSESDWESVFVVAYGIARTFEDTRVRVDAFRNQYGLCRNIALVALVSSVALVIFGLINRDPASGTWAAALAVVGVVMTQRFLKFYAAFSAEVLRALLR